MTRISNRPVSYMRRRGGRRTEGFTLIEAMVVVAIIGIVSALSYAALFSLRGQATFSEGAAKIEQAVRRARAESLGRGVPVAFVLDSVDQRWWVLDAGAGFDLGTFDPTSEANVIDRGSLPRTVSIGPDEGVGVVLPAPFAGIPTIAGGPNLPYCSFCDAGSGFGAIVFQPRGPAVFSDGPATMGQQFSVTGAEDSRRRTRAIAVVAANGLVEAFEP